jgi:MFS family permease
MRRDPRWELWTPAVTYAISIPLNAGMILAPHWWGVIAFNAIGNVFSAMGAGAALSAVQTFAEPHRRATAVSLILFLSALLGSGGGAWLIGVLADVLTPQFGDEGLRFGMLISVVMFVPGILAFVLAGLRSPRDRVA